MTAEEVNKKFDEILSAIKDVDTRLRNLEIAYASSEGYRKAQAAIWGIASGLFTSIISGVVIWLIQKN